MGDAKVEGLRLRDTETGDERVMPIEGLFIAIGHGPNTEAFRDWLEVDATGYLVVHDETGSKVDGVFIAGDVHDHRYRQAVTAAADGCKAAIDAERWLEAQGSPRPRPPPLGERRPRSRDDAARRRRPRRGARRPSRRPPDAERPVTSRVPPSDARPTIRRIVAFFRPYRAAGRRSSSWRSSPRASSASSTRAAQAADRPGHRRQGLHEPQPVRRADDRHPDRLGADRRRPELPQQRHRPERHAGPAERALRATSSACRCGSSPRRGPARSRAGWPTTSAASRPS